MVDAPVLARARAVTARRGEIAVTATEAAHRCRARWIRWGLAVVWLSCAAGCLSGPITLEAVFLRPTAEMKTNPAEHGWAYDEVYLPISASRQVCIWHVYSDRPKGIVVVIPGSDTNKSTYVIGLPVFIPNGYDVILLDYEGFGDSTDAPLRLKRLVENGLAAVRFAQTQHENVVVFGISTGGPIAVHVAAQLDLAAVILEAPLVLEHEVELWLRDKGLAIPLLWEVANLWVHPQIPDSFDILKYIELVEEPKLIMQSVEDRTVPYPAGLSVYQAAPQPKTFFEMRGGHGKMIELEPELYTRTIVSWLDSVILDGADL